MTLPGRLFPTILLLVPACCGAGSFSMDSLRRDGGVDIVAVAELRAEPDRAWSVLTSYESYPEFIPDLTTSRIVQREGAALVVDLTGVVRFLWWKMPVAVQLAVTEAHPRRVHARLITGTVEDMEGLYELEPTPGGSRLTYTGRVVPERSQRSLLDRLVVRLNVSRQFGALIDEIERGAPPAAGQR